MSDGDDLTGRWGLLQEGRAVAPELRLRLVVLDGHRRVAVRICAAVAALAVDYVTDERGDLAHVLDVARWWVAGRAGTEGLRAARARAAEVAARTDRDGDRGGWLALQVAVTLADVALEPMADIAGKRARDLVVLTREALCWPDVDDEGLRDAADRRVHEAIDAAQSRRA